MASLLGHFFDLSIGDEFLVEEFKLSTAIIRPTITSQMPERGVCSHVLAFVRVYSELSTSSK